MEILLKRFNQILTISMGMVLFDIVVGCLLFFEASFVTKVNAVLIGCLLLVHGLFQMIRYFYHGKSTRFFLSDFIMSIVGIVVGLFSVFNPADTIKIVGILFGVWVLLYGVERFYYAFCFMKAKDEIFPLILFIAVLFILMGILILFNPFASFMLITKLIGMFILILSVLDLMTYSLYKKRSKEILKLFS